MSPSPASECIALASTVVAATTAWVGGKLLAVGTITKEDIMGPFGALMVCFGALVALAFYYVKRQKTFDAREERREERREEHLVHIASIAEASNRAVEASNEAISEMKKTVDRFERCVEESNRALRGVQEQLRGCPRNNNPQYHERTET